MSPIWLTPFIIVAGALQAFGAVMSAQLRVSLTNPWLALTVLFTLNAFFFAGLFAVLPRPLPTIDGISAMPWWAPLAGLTGAVAVFAGLALIDKIEAGPVNGLIIMANHLASLAIDHFGLMNMPVHALNALGLMLAWSSRRGLAFLLELSYFCCSSRLRRCKRAFHGRRNFH